MQQPARTDERQPHQRTIGAQQCSRVKPVTGGMTTVEGGRGAIKKRMARQPSTKVSMMREADNRAGIRQQSKEECNNHTAAEMT
jgi:hypothetical protein